MAIQPALMTVLGAGSYGTALAMSLARNGNRTVLWGHDAEHINELAEARCNEAYLPDLKFPETLILETDLEQAVAASRDILIVFGQRWFYNNQY